MNLTAQRHPESWIPQGELGSRIPTYLPTFEWGSPFINPNHASFSTCPSDGCCIELGIPGWLRHADALKLYEMAFFSSGDILEVGSYHGLSTTILATAVQDAGHQHRIMSVELDPHCSLETERNLKSRGLDHLVTLYRSPAEKCLPELVTRGNTFGFAFIDHDHSYEAVLYASHALSKLIRPGGFALFHDFNAPLNDDPSCPGMDVPRAISTGLSEEFEFYGIYGCTALYRRKFLG